MDPTRRGNDATAFEQVLRRNIVGQEQAISSVVEVYQMYMAGLNALGRPVGNLLFLGPTGSGKTRVAEVMSLALYGNTGAVVKIDCAEFQHPHEIAKLIGSPPGYLGHRETRPLLSQERLDQPHTDKVKLTILLFDEIEKASDALWQLLLGILHKPTLTLGDNQRVDLFPLRHHHDVEPWLARDIRLGKRWLRTRTEAAGASAGNRPQDRSHWN